MCHTASQAARLYCTVTLRCFRGHNRNPEQKAVAASPVVQLRQQEKCPEAPMLKA